MKGEQMTDARALALISDAVTDSRGYGIPTIGNRDARYKWKQRKCALNHIASRLAQPATADEYSKDVRALIYCDTQFSMRGETELGLDEIERLTARGWIATDPDEDHFVTPSGRQTIAIALQQPIAQESACELWCLHILGPDDVIPSPSQAHAERAAAKLNDWYAKQSLDEYAPAMKAVAALWPHDAKSHAERVETFIEEWLLPIGQVSKQNEPSEIAGQLPAQEAASGPVAEPFAWFRHRGSNQSGEHWTEYSDDSTRPTGAEWEPLYAATPGQKAISAEERARDVRAGLRAALLDPGHTRNAVNAFALADGAAEIPPAQQEVADARDAARYRCMRAHIKFANDSLNEIWFSAHADSEPEDERLLDGEIDAMMALASPGAQGGV